MVEGEDERLKSLAATELPRKSLFNRSGWLEDGSERIEVAGIVGDEWKTLVNIPTRGSFMDDDEVDIETSFEVDISVKGSKGKKRKKKPFKVNH